MPPVNAPSPMMATTLPGSPLIFLARAMPMATDSAVLPWPAINASQSLSAGLGKPEMPSFWRSWANPARRPVSNLWV